MIRKKYIHDFNRECPFGGTTFALEYEMDDTGLTDSIIVGVAHCSSKDMYSRKTGRELADQRVEEFKSMNKKDTIIVDGHIHSFLLEPRLFLTSFFNKAGIIFGKNIDTKFFVKDIDMTQFLHMIKVCICMM